MKSWLSIALLCFFFAAQVNVATAQNGTEPGQLHSTVADLPPEAQAVIVPQLAKLSASDGLPGDYFGDVAAMSGDTVVVGRIYGGSGQQGAAYVFVKPPTGWANMTQTARLTASDGGPGDEFGSAVAISGNTIVVAKGTGEEIPAYVFIEPEGGWTDMSELAKLSTPWFPYGGGANPGLATNGHTVFLGIPWAPYKEIQFEGVVCVFVEPAGGWVNMNPTAKLVASDAGNDSLFGDSISVSGDTVAVGRGWSGGPIDVFVRPTGGWRGTLNQTASLSASDGSGLFYVSMSGSTIAAGAPFAVVGANHEAGAVYVFVKPPTGWANMNETARLTASYPGFDDELGASVAVSNGGNRVIAGAPHRSSDTGALYLFTKPASGWVTMAQSAVMLASDGTEGDFLGTSAASNGQIMITGAPQYSIPEPGVVYVFGKQ